MYQSTSPTMLCQTQTDTAKDPILTSLRSVISCSCPKKRSECPVHLHSYWNYRDKLTVSDGLILKKICIIIPKSLQLEVLKQIHYPHQGAENASSVQKVQSSGQTSMQILTTWWKAAAPVNITRSWIQRNQWHHMTCLQNHGTTLHLMLFWNNRSYLLLADYYSKFPLIRKLYDIKSETVSKHMKGILEEHGIL